MAPPTKLDKVESSLEGAASSSEPGEKPLLGADELIAKSVLGYATWTFTIPFFKKALTKGGKLSPADVPACPAADNPREQAARMRNLLAKHSPVQAYIWFVYPEFLRAFGFTCITLALMFFQIKAVQFVVESLQDIQVADALADSAGVDAASKRGYMWATLMGLSPIISSMFLQQAMMLGYTAGRRAYAAYTSLLFEKPALVTAGALGQLEEGKIVNMMSADCLLVLNITLFLQFSFFAGTMLIAASALIIYELGYIGVPAIAALICISFVNKRVGTGVQKNMKRKNTSADDRSSQLNETVKGIRTIKLYAWEDVVTTKIAPIRKAEVNELKIIAWKNAGLTFLMSAFPKMALAGTLLLYVHLRGNLTAAKAVAVVNWFEYLNMGAMIIPMIAVQWGEMKQAIGRMGKLLTMEQDFVAPKSQGEPGQVEVKNATFSWGIQASPAGKGDGDKDIKDGKKKKKKKKKDAEEEAKDTIPTAVVPAVRDISLSIKPGALVAIVGEVAAGKTTLAHGLLSLVRLESGTVRVGGKTALVAQKSFISNDSVRDNILFESAFDKKRYDEAVHACVLEQDFAAFVDGDSTEVGERGVTISGGQKQRVALARAAYSKADVVIFDDPLSAMDAHVGMQVFRRCFQTMMKGRTRIFFTNQLQYCEHCDFIYVLKDGELMEQGTYTELLNSKSSDGLFHTMMVHQVGSNTGSSIGSSREKTSTEKEADAVSIENADQKKNDTYAAEAATAKEASSPRDEDTADEKTEAGAAEEKSPAALMQAEAKTTVRPSVLYMLVLAKAVKGQLLVTIAILCFFITPLAEWFQFYFLFEWTQKAEQDGLPTSAVWYICMAAAFSFMIAISSPTYAYFFLRCSTKLHENMLEKVLSQTMKWFDTTPVGRIINVFSGDMMQIDMMLPRTFQWWVNQVGGIVAAIVGAAVIVPHNIPCTLLLVMLCVGLYKTWGSINIEMKRLYMMSIGPILSSFSSYLQGLDTIRAYGCTEVFADKFDVAICGFMDVSYWQTAIDRLSNFISGGPGVAFSIMLPLACIVINLKLAPAMGALMLMNSMVAMRLPFAILTTVTIENFMVSAQRLVEYIKLENEPALLDPPSPPVNVAITAATATAAATAGGGAAGGGGGAGSGVWLPSAGALELVDVKMRYAKDLPYALCGASLKVDPCMKVGVVGRTGAGKSSLILAIFRMMELDGGDILVDGHSIRSMPVRQLRAALGMIPQDTFMFSGTIRTNLDVTGNTYTDDALWAVLRQVSLQDAVGKMDGGLEHTVMEGGSNLSAGTVQLICLARVLLKNPKILFMDEATASVDLATDTLVQATIRRAFSNSTIITIAHRLNTVIDFDRIAVMDKGKVAEYDAPSTLLANQRSLFSKLVDSAGASTAAELRNRAISSQQQSN